MWNWLNCLFSYPHKATSIFLPPLFVFRPKFEFSLEFTQRRLVKKSTHFWKKHTSLVITPTPQHRWELPVLRYHGIRDNYQYPFLRVIVLAILHDFIRQNYHKNQSERYPFFLIMVNYPISLVNYHILYFQMYYQYLFFLSKYPNNVSKKEKNSAIFGTEFLIETIVSKF